VPGEHSNALILVIGIGNPYRNDDGAGIIIARRIRELNLEGVAVAEETGEASRLLDAWAGMATAIIIDAVFSGGGQPGEVHRIDAIAQEIPSEYFRHSTHAFGVAAAIELARVLNRLPKRLIVYGIEGKDFGDGTALTPEVEAAVSRVIEALADEIRNIGASRPEPGRD
jgi:hydrogenase maturation protease